MGEEWHAACWEQRGWACANRTQPGTIIALHAQTKLTHIHTHLHALAHAHMLTLRFEGSMMRCSYIGFIVMKMARERSMLRLRPSNMRSCMPVDAQLVDL